MNKIFQLLFTSIGTSQVSTIGNPNVIEVDHMTNATSKQRTTNIDVSEMNTDIHTRSRTQTAEAPNNTESFLQLSDDDGTYD